MIQNFNTGLESFVLLALLIAVFIIAFKVLEIIFETITVSVLSAVFYLALVYLFDYQMALDRVLLFAFLGAALYLGYSLIASIYALTVPFIKLPFKIASGFLELTRQILGVDRKQKTSKANRQMKKKLDRYGKKLKEYGRRLEAGMTQDSDMDERTEDSVPDHEESGEDNESSTGEDKKEDEQDEDVKEVVLKKVKENKDEEED